MHAAYEEHILPVLAATTILSETQVSTLCYKPRVLSNNWWVHIACCDTLVLEGDQGDEARPFLNPE